MGSKNRFKLGLFGANCSSGRAVTTVPERWSGSRPDCVRLAQMADRAGIELCCRSEAGAAGQCGGPRSGLGVGDREARADR